MLALILLLSLIDGQQFFVRAESEVKATQTEQASNKMEETETSSGKEEGSEANNKENGKQEEGTQKEELSTKATEKTTETKNEDGKVDKPDNLNKENENNGQENGGKNEEKETGDKGEETTKENAEKLLPYGVDNVYVYEHEGFEGFRADCYTDAVADCIAANKPSSVLIGATALGRSLAPRLSTRFHTGLTADCTTLDIRSNTDMIQIRPAFGGNIMAQIGITKSRPQFATVRYKVMDKAEKIKNPHGQVVVCPVNEKMADSRIKILSSRVIDKVKSLEEEDVLVVAGRGVRNEKDVEMCRELADALGGQLAFTRPMVENGFGDVAHQIGLSGRTVRPKLIITCGVSGAIQFTSCMTGSDCIVAINNDSEAQIFNVADYCIVDDLYQVVPELTELIKNRKED